MNLKVVIVNYRTPRLTLEAVRSLAKLSLGNTQLEVFVVDNFSGDDSLSVFHEELQSVAVNYFVNLIAAPKNGGFAYGNNLAIGKFATSLQRGRSEKNKCHDVIWLLNPDTYLVDTQSFQLMLDWFVSQSQVGILGTAILNEDGSVRRSAFRFPTVYSEIESGLGIGFVSRLLDAYLVAPPPSKQPCRTDWVSGASLLIRSDVLDAIGGLDEQYFMYFEETDYCRAAAAKGYETWYWPAVSVVHLVGQASGVTGRERRFKRRPSYWFDSRRRYFVKNCGWISYHGGTVAWLVAYPIGRLWGWLRRRPVEDPPKLWWDLFVHYLRTL